MEFRWTISFRGYHIYKDAWDAALGEDFTCFQESSKVHDLYAVVIIRHSNTVGQIP